ncbi:MAG: GumC family protein, partial [Verrucomicrobiia bacterium]
MENAKTTIPAQTAVPESQLHFLDYWRIIRIRKTIILAVFLLVLLTTTAVTFVLPESYMSTAKIAIEKEATDIEPLGRSQSSLQYDPYFVNTEFEKIQSKSVLYPVITNLSLTKIYADKDHYGDRADPNPAPWDLQDTYKQLRKNLDVRLSRNTSLIEIRAYDRKKEIAAAIANEVASSYKKWRLSDKEENSKRGIEVLTNKLVDINEQVNEAQTRVNELRSKYNIADSAAETPVYQVSLEREKVSALAVELTRAEAEYVFYKTKLDELAKLNRFDLRKALLTAMPTEQQLPQLLSELALAEQTLAQRKVDYSGEHPEVKRAAVLLEQVNKQIEDRLDGILSGLTNQVVSLKARRDQLQKAVEEA